MEVRQLKYISVAEAATKWGISKRRVQILCSENRVKGAYKVGNEWIIPHTTKKPNDARKSKKKD